MKYLSDEEILLFHRQALLIGGGAPGVRDPERIESAANRPRHTSYSTPFQKASVLGEELVKGHPFIDGNKRTALLSIAVFLFKNGYKLNLQKEDTVLQFCGFADCSVTKDDIEDWLSKNSTRYSQ